MDYKEKYAEEILKSAEERAGENMPSNIRDLQIKLMVAMIDQGEKSTEKHFLGIIDKWVSDNKTSWKFLKRKGFPEAEKYGDCIFINHKLESGDINSIQNLKNELIKK